MPTKIKRGTAHHSTPGGLLSISMSRCIVGRKRKALSGKRTMRSLRLDTKKVELVRLVFSIGVTVFVSVGTFLAIRYLIGSSG
jgi:hypothetical protein